tara:strand:+ start:125 stop:304 length:180 start_codon:yes stop_codon:yes gene_type:complete
MEGALAAVAATDWSGFAWSVQPLIERQHKISKTNWSRINHNASTARGEDVATGLPASQP